MWPRFGIKIGNSTLCIAHVKADGKVEVIANKQGDRVSQACILWNGDEIECGLTAKQKMATRPKQAVAHSFQLLLPQEDLSEDRINAASKEIPCEYDATEHVFRLKSIIPSDNDGDDKELVKKLTAYDVHVRLFRAELELARQYHTGDDKPIVVLSIPSYYPDMAYSLLADVAKDAGFHVAQILTEPTAAVLGYSIGEEDDPTADTLKHVLTIKCGGLYSHFALYAVCNGYLTEVATFGPFAIGGRQYTDALVQFICEEFQRKYKLDPHESRRSLAKIRTTAANSKHILTTMPSTQLYIDSLMDGIDYNSQMSRARFESLIQPAINNFMQTLSECVDKALKQNPEVTRIDEIVLLGATMQIPKLQAAVAARFPDAKLHNTLSADEVVAVGCARQALYLLDATEQQLARAEDCVLANDDLYIWHGDDEANAKLVVGKGAILPATVNIDLQQSKEADQAEIFKLRAGGNEIVAQLTNTTPGEDGVYQLQVEVDWNDQDDSIVPLVRLRCI